MVLRPISGRSVRILAQFAAALLLGVAATSRPIFAAAYEPAQSNRVVINFDRDWKFIRQDVPGADKPDYNDAAWNDVGLPHTYNDQDTYDKPNDPEFRDKKPTTKPAAANGSKSKSAKVKAKDEANAGAEADAKPEQTPEERAAADQLDPKKKAEADFKLMDAKGGDGGWGGKTWYRKHFTLDPQYRDRKIYIEIEAARTLAEVYINGQHLGRYASGFSSFAYDLTPYVSFDHPNVLSVMVDDTEGESIAAGNRSHWQPVLGGLYRNVYLYVTDKLHVTLPYYSDLKTEGTYVGTPKVSQQSADFRMTTEVRNAYDKAITASLTTDIVDRSGKILATMKDSKEIPAGGLFKFDQSTTLRRPHLWTLDDPYLYTVYSTVHNGDTVTDVYTTPLGVRTIGFDHPHSRFQINGQEVALHGWGQKPENSWPGLGSALPDWLLANDMQMMKDAGGNIVRWGHCAGPVAELDAGDRIGFLNWQANISGESDYKGAVWDNKVMVLRDLVIRDRNHPSICWWEGNNRDTSAEHTKEMKEVIHTWDWIAPRPFANRRPYSPETAPLQDFAMEENASKNSIPGKAMVEAEFYRPETDRRAWDLDSPPFKACDNEYWRTEFDAMRGIVKDWKGIAARGGGVKWHFTDDTTHGRLGPYANARLSGSLDATRLPKDIYYGMKVLYSDPSQPVIHIMGHWNYEQTKKHTIDVYANTDEIQLEVNGKSLGRKPVEDWHATWENVPFEPGMIKATGYNAGSPDAFDERHTASAPAAIKLEVMTDPDGMKADRADVALITATIVDANGVWHPLADNDITFAVTGPGNYRGGANMTIQGTTGKPTLKAEAGKIRVSVRSTDKAGTVTVTASSPGLQPGKVSFDVLPVEASVATKTAAAN
jgi:beta-galactosidase